MTFSGFFVAMEKLTGSLCSVLGSERGLERLSGPSSENNVDDDG